MTATGIKTLEQKRASHAWKRIEETKKLGDDDKAKKSFKTEIKKTPTRIVSSGLGQALAFLDAKQKAPNLVAALSDWIKLRRGLNHQKDLLKAIIHGNAEYLRYATAESLAYLEWMVKLAEAEGLVGGDEESK